MILMNFFSAVCYCTVRNRLMLCSAILFERKLYYAIEFP